MYDSYCDKKKNWFNVHPQVALSCLIDTIYDIKTILLHVA